MAQHDYVIDNQAFPATRADINSVLQAIVSNNSGSSAPSTTFSNQIWYDSSANILYIRNEDNDANIPLLQLDQSGDVAATLATIIDVLDKSGTNTAGTDLTIRAGAGTGTGAGGKIILQTADGGSSGSSVNSHATAVTILDDGKTGILETAPTVPLEVKGAQAFGSSASNLSTSTTKAAAKIRGSSDASTALFFGSITNDAEQYIQSSNGAGSAADDIILNPFGGTVMIAQTANDSGVAGHIFNNNGSATHVRDGGVALVINRLTDDGALVAFKQAGSTDGQINSRSGQLSIGSGDTGLEFNNANDGVLPHDSANNTGRDNAIDLGSSSARFDDIFATNTSIQTSDQNEKQDIASLTDTEITAAKAISKLFKTFKWKDKVASKGDSARTHAGVMAQEVQSAMTDAGLDATKYAFWCSDTWWETQTEVPAVKAVEAQDAVLDDDGNIVTEAVEAVEAQDAYTRTDTYDTADEAPEGATERTRLGIRYPELLAFIGAATEQRLTSIEARLTALEA